MSKKQKQGLYSYVMSEGYLPSDIDSEKLTLAERDAVLFASVILKQWNADPEKRYMYNSEFAALLAQHALRITKERDIFRNALEKAGIQPIKLKENEQLAGSFSSMMAKLNGKE